MILCLHSKVTCWWDGMVTWHLPMARDSLNMEVRIGPGLTRVTMATVMPANTQHAMGISIYEYIVLHFLHWILFPLNIKATYLSLDPIVTSVCTQQAHPPGIQKQADMLDCSLMQNPSLGFISLSNLLNEQPLTEMVCEKTHTLGQSGCLSAVISRLGCQALGDIVVPLVHLSVHLSISRVVCHTFLKN